MFVLIYCGWCVSLQEGDIVDMFDRQKDKENLQEAIEYHGNGNFVLK